MNKKLIIFACLILTVFALSWGVGQVGAAPVLPADYVPGANGLLIPDYFTTPNWANSPPLTKFVDGLPGICGATPGANALGQCIPIALPDTTTYPGSDYYEIELVQYREQMHSMFGAVAGDKTTAASGGTKLRGYRQTNPGGVQTPNAVPHYLGPLILASKYDPALPAGVGRTMASRSVSSSPTAYRRAAACFSRWTPPSWVQGHLRSTIIRKQK